LNQPKSISTIQKIFAFLLVLGLSPILFSQQPAYFNLGEQQFSGIQIYDIIQDKNLNYLFATNEGIYYYDYYTYKKIECDDAKSNAVFNFELDQKGIIYCHNLNNQIFKLEEDQCQLFYELKKEERKPDISLAITKNGELIIGANGIIVLNNNQEVISRHSTNGQSLGPVFNTEKHGIQFHLTNSDSIIVYSEGQFIRKKLNFVNGGLTHPSILKFFRMGQQSYAFEKYSKTLYTYNTSNLQLNPLPKTQLSSIEGAPRIYETGSEFWASGTFPGVTFFKGNTNSIYSETYYSDYFISTVYKDREGNILLGTFDKGVLVIPDLRIPDKINLTPDDPAISIYADSSKGLYIGSSKGKLISYANGKINIISDMGKHPVEGIYGNVNSDLLIFDNGLIRAYHKKTGQVFDLIESSLKDAAVISNQEFYLGTNNGLIKIESKTPSTYQSIHHPDISQRIYCIEYNPISKYLYASTADGMFVLLPSNNAKKIQYMGRDIFPIDLHYSNGKIFAITHKQGILIIEDKKVTGTIQPMINGQVEDLKKIMIYQNNLIGNSANGLFRFDMNGKLLNSFSSMYRLKSNRIIDFTIDKNSLWVCHSGGIQWVSLDYQRSNILIPGIRFDDIQVNDQSLINFQEGNFKTDERKIQFNFSSPTLKERENILYHYQLVGYDANWKVQPYDQNTVIYNALAPGTYTMQVKSENQGKFSATISYTFTINKPFYATAWFIVLAIIIFLAIVYIIYRWQLNTQRKKSQKMAELNASKLTAIQSQMNPHFIFNSLNSIQDLILKGDVEHSYSYITTFSNLVRRTLSYSEKDYIDFEQEIKLLELYLSLEKLRYKKDLQYSIHIKNVEDIMLPPLLIQPFIENALVHGLLHKEGDKILTISFELQEVLICTIEDNGIGREQAKAIKLRQRSDHESFSGKAIQKRFEILSKLLKGQFGYTYEDLYNNGHPSGTRIILHIPIKRKF
jgi:ligand-binding sensor domain-containing protein/cbb3-type cytochrome oxidase subunit 3